MFANLNANSELMRAFLPFGLLTVVISSCSHYQYVTISALDAGRNANQEFVEENDSVRIQYSFYGPDAPINLLVENKTDVPIYIDWSRSALIINDKAISYVANVALIEDVFNNGFASSGSVYAMATLPENLSFIPPRSYINKSPMSVTNQLMVVPDSVFRTERMTLYDGSIVKVKHAFFTEESSPLRFKSYLTMTFGDQNNKTVAYQCSFFISEVYDSATDPETFLLNRERGDQFYVRETTAAGQGFGIVAGIALLSTAAVLESKSTNNPNQ